MLEELDLKQKDLTNEHLRLYDALRHYFNKVGITPYLTHIQSTKPQH